LSKGKLTVIKLFQLTIRVAAPDQLTR
jgi:hypothetical protein